jgi:hypothetical protein
MARCAGSGCAFVRWIRRPSRKAAGFQLTRKLSTQLLARPCIGSITLGGGGGVELRPTTRRRSTVVELKLHFTIATISIHQWSFYATVQAVQPASCQLRTSGIWNQTVCFVYQAATGYGCWLVGIHWRLDCGRNPASGHDA